MHFSKSIVILIWFAHSGDSLSPMNCYDSKKFILCTRERTRGSK